MQLGQFLAASLGLPRRGRQCVQHRGPINPILDEAHAPLGHFDAVDGGHRRTTSPRRIGTDELGVHLLIAHVRGKEPKDATFVPIDRLRLHLCVNASTAPMGRINQPSPVSTMA